MGKLAERYGDAARSGLYRVRDAGVPRAAAAEAGARVVETTAEALVARGLGRLRDEMRLSNAAACVVLVEGGGALDGEDGLLEELRAAALGAGAAGGPRFIVLVDPLARLALPLLYHEEHAAAHAAAPGTLREPS